jgi:prepilin-type N-terminal cleavage/methylation domain-containing protein
MKIRKQINLQERAVLQTSKLPFLQQRQSGFTIIESLVAIVVLTTLLAAIAPVIALSVATRVQARRVEVATQAAKTYIDGVRSGAIATPNHVISALTDNLQRNSFAAVSVPGSTSVTATSCSTTATSYPYCQNDTTLSLYCVDLDGGGCTNTSIQDFVIQAFRTGNDKNYLLGLRVYRADSIKSGVTLAGGTGTKTATFTGGLGDRKFPLVEITTDIVASGQTTDKFQDFCARLGGC